MPPAWWVAREALTLAAFGEDAADVARAAYFVAYLDARSPLPIANDHRFHLELYRAALAAHWTRRPTRAGRASAGFAAEGCTALGFEPPLLVSASLRGHVQDIAGLGRECRRASKSQYRAVCSARARRPYF